MSNIDGERLKASAIMKAEILMQDMSEEKRDGFQIGIKFMADLLVEVLKVPRILKRKD